MIKDKSLVAGVSIKINSEAKMKKTTIYSYDSQGNYIDKEISLSEDAIEDIAYQLAKFQYENEKYEKYNFSPYVVFNSRGECAVFNEQQGVSRSSQDISRYDNWYAMEDFYEDIEEDIEDFISNLIVE